MSRPLRIGSRGSALALWQANFVKVRLERECAAVCEIRVIKTTGDRQQSAPLTAFGGKGVFVKEIEEALLRDEIDLAVHSMKDVPTEIPEELTIAAICERVDVRDALISSSGRKLADLPHGSRVGTSSLRRRAQLMRARPDLEFVELRGNVDTRLKKLDAGDCDALVLAWAGLDRLGLAARITETLSCEVSLPAVGQGALGIETRRDDEAVIKTVARLDHRATRAAVLAERELLREVEGGCQIPLGAWARTESGRLVMDACIVSLDGRDYVRTRVSGEEDSPESLGRRAAEELFAGGAERILQVAGRNVAGN
ncbi:MAG TPA: hydroxymethylbilane synthase [Candidatus Acidoferrales bacterium]|nr:hydroxymethylbilane synthase [Candidatus Acidoferrales bacterium]